LSRSPTSTFSAIDMVGKGFDFWKTIPIRRRIATASMPGP